ncbi:hypothetical protein GD627_02250 [Arthrobacter yangruifuii]|uniref:Saccharopine dehydrogenase NADP binding domain-containing protein n=1 Tax=Arthrobacter yangruifuii TaxID=2606616 RepID=A0A5N6MSS1_9MICC|nr:saccharopine dehydrogenase NADP-binding domain-containing protein [Arthrobacter yangruifuii]KAD4059926.1 hypothetical protein GD627_02250 [Arthrobacter yangruifuii]
MDDKRKDEIWILGATGKVGRALAGRLAAARIPGVVLVGRSTERLAAIADTLNGSVRTRQLAGVAEMLAAVPRERPLVVINLLGSYAETAIPLAKACMPDGHYVDLSIDINTLSGLVDLHGEARAANSTVIGGAGFGVLATEALVVRLCEGQPTPSRVQIDALSSYAPDDGVMGEALAITSVDVMSMGGRAYRDGILTPVPLGSNLRKHALPDGTAVKSAAVPSGELFAARQASKAPTIDFTSALAPTSPLIRPALPLLSRLLKSPTIRRTMITSLAASKTKRAPRPRPHSWGHAVVDWADGTRRESWLRADDAMDYTADVLTAVVRAFVDGTAPRGAFTPAAALGPGLATDAGATFIDG